MTIELSNLPAEPPMAWTKPTLANTKGGKLYKPTHSELFRVEFTAASPSNGDEESFSSKLVALQDFPPNSVITNLTNLSRAPEKAYSSVQHGSGPHDHFELNSDLLFMNHSCDPSVYVVLSSKRPSEWHVQAGPNGVKKGEDMTFFYPSTEWDMAQGFDCNCGAKWITETAMRVLKRAEDGGRDWHSEGCAPNWPHDWQSQQAIFTNLAPDHSMINCLKSVRGAKYLSLPQLEERGYVNEHIRQMKQDQQAGQ